MKVLFLEDNEDAKKNIRIVNDDYFTINFVSTVTLFDELIFDQAGFASYDAIVMDLCINMPLMPDEQIKEMIPLLNSDDVPTYCNPERQSIPLWGLDYFRLVMNEKSETKSLVEQGRVIFFSGHAERIVKQGLYSADDEMFAHVELLNRFKHTPKLFEKLKEIEQSLD